MNDTVFQAEVSAEIAADIKLEKALIERECEYLNESASDRLESSSWPRSVTLDCGCEVHIKRVDDGMESWWTERDWTLCDKHEAMGVEP
jgi:hypothetical protein